jgi:hypothetical protein
MRIKLTFAIVVGLLFCSIATLELPELINLVDDTSNDFSVVVLTKRAVTIVKVQPLDLNIRPVLADIQGRQPSGCLPPQYLIQPFDTPNDLLHLLHVQRT